MLVEYTDVSYSRALAAAPTGSGRNAEFSYGSISKLFQFRNSFRFRKVFGFFETVSKAVRLKSSEKVSEKLRILKKFRQKYEAVSKKMRGLNRRCCPRFR